MALSSELAVRRCRCHPAQDRVDSFRSNGTVLAGDDPRLRTDRAKQAARRAELGLLAKRLLDEARASWLRRSCGWKEVQLVQYAAIEVTPENHLLIASP